MLKMREDSSPIQRTLFRILVATIGLAAILQAGRMLVGPDRGLQAEYFVGEQTSGRPAIIAIDPTISTEQILRRWSGATPAAFSARWFGFLTVARKLTPNE